MTIAALDKSWLSFWLVSGPLWLAFMNMAFSLHIYHRYLDALMDALKNSRYIQDAERELRNQGWRSAIQVVAKITGMILLPRASIRIGELDAADLQNFPPHLRRLLIIDAVMLLTCLVWGGGVWVFLESG